MVALRSANEYASDAELTIFADSLIDYRAAQKNIDEYGTIVIHPRTGAPITNPYIPIRAAAAKQILEIKIDSSGLWSDG